MFVRLPELARNDTRNSQRPRPWRAVRDYVFGIVLLIGMVTAYCAAAEPHPRLDPTGAAPLQMGAKPLLVSLPRPPIVGAVPSVKPVGSSLFIGRASGGLFEPVAPKQPKTPKVPAQVEPYEGAVTDVERIRYVIGQAESRNAGYDAVNYGAKIKPKRRPTEMTLREIYAWIDATPGQPHAIGRYQFIPKTLRRLVDQLDVPLEAKFSPAIQDRLSDQLLYEAGLREVRNGNLSRKAFMHNLTKIWAGLPMANGKSYYHGYAGNKASITYAQFDKEMAEIFPS